jgi:hypothetical protein
LSGFFRVRIVSSCPNVDERKTNIPSWINVYISMQTILFVKSFVLTWSIRTKKKERSGGKIK